MNPLLKEIRHNPLLWLLAFVPVLFVAQNIKPDAHTLLFVLSVLAIVPLAGLLSHATELWRPRRATPLEACSTPRSET
jgi:Ca2+:H+ antiporter